ncbi:MAG: hypothetical protein QW273_02435 [Candidatus Pacearchaeota archaeon]
MKKKTRKKSSKNASSNNIKISPVSKEYILIVTEKLQAALKITMELGNYKKISDTGADYFEIEHENKKILVASAAGPF